MITQAHNGSAQQVSSPKYLIGAHQTLDRIDAPNKNKNNAVFDHLNGKNIMGKSMGRDNHVIVFL